MDTKLDATAKYPAGITVVIPAHKARMKNGMLERALRSVYGQELQPDAISIAVDIEGEGAAKTRQRALMAARTKYVAYLDSDDEWLPQHLRVLFDAAESTGAAFVFPWFEPVGMPDHVGHFGKTFDREKPHLTTTTVFCWTEVAQEIGFRGPEDSAATIGDEDWKFVLDFCEIAKERDLKMIHHPERTWRYHYHGRNCSGLPYKGDGPLRWQ